MNPRVAVYFDSLPEELKPAVFETRDMILDLAPGIEECWKWGLAFYTWKGSLCYFNKSKSGIYLGLFHGPKLEDPYGVLSGHKLKAVRHLELLPFDESKKEAIKDLVLQVLDLNQKKRG